MHFHIFLPSLLATSAAAAPHSALYKRSTTLIPTSCFDDTASLTTYFNYNYPWGDTHNGAAIMSSANAVVSPAGTLSLSATYTGPQSAHSGISYDSGTVYAKQEFTVAAGGGLDFSAQFIAPTARGTWPAFWLTGVSSWPPEIDMAEWKGDGEISFNTFNTSNAVTAHNVAYPNAGDWHTVMATLRAESDGSTVETKFYLDGVEQTTQYAQNTVGKSLYLIIDLQMEGSSGSPGPTSETLYQLKDLSVVSYNP